MVSESAETTVRMEKDSSGVPAISEISPIIRRLRKVLQVRQNNKLLAAMGDLSIPAVEFSPKNLGISEITGNLVMLDASLWQKYVPVK